MAMHSNHYAIAVLWTGQAFEFTDEAHLNRTLDFWRKHMTKEEFDQTNVFPICKKDKTEFMLPKDPIELDGFATIVKN